MSIERVLWVDICTNVQNKKRQNKKKIQLQYDDDISRKPMVAVVASWWCVRLASQRPWFKPGNNSCFVIEIYFIITLLTVIFPGVKDG